MRESALRLTRGWDQARIRAIVRETLVEVIEPIIFDEALDLIREHQAAGRRVFIVSASPEEIVAPLAQFLGVDEAIATRAELDEEGRYTGDVEFSSTARTRSRPSARSPSATASTSSARTPTRTRSPTSRCSSSSAIRSR